jgi:hypothetical protein
MKRMPVFVLAVLLLAPMSVNATASDETRETIEVLSDDVTGTGGASSPKEGIINTVVIDPSTSSILYAGTEGGLLKSINGGASWSATGLTGVCALAIDPKNASIIYAQSVDSIYKSTDWGGHWSKLTQDFPGVVGYSLAIAPSNPSILYSGTNHGISKTEDGGGAWSHGQGPTDPYALAIDSLNASNVFVGTGNGVFKSTDGGLTWSAIGPTNTHVLALAIDPSTPSTIFAGTDGNGVFKSTDGGLTWSAIGPTNTHVLALAIDPSTPSTIFAGTDGDGVFKSTDWGVSWSAIGPTNTHILALAIDPSVPSIIFAGTDGDGMFKSTDGGASWNASNDRSLITVTPTAQNYGNVKVKRSKAASFKVKNVGKANLSILTSTITGPDASMFTITNGGGSKTIKPGKSLTLKAAFKPTSTGSKSATLEITSDDPFTPIFDIPLSGTGQ